MRGGSPFDTHTGWTHGAEQLAASVHRRERDALNKLPNVEVLPDDREVGAYLEEKHPDRSEAPARDIEQVLMDDLWMVYASDDGDETEREAQKDRLRRLIWKNSRRINRSELPDAALLAAIRLEREVKEKQLEAGLSGMDTEEEAEDRLARITDLKDALAQDIRGEGHGENDDLRTVLDTIEGEFSSALHATKHGLTEAMKKQAAQDLSDLRLIRDELYLRHLFPKTAELRIRAARRTVRARKAA